MSAFSIAVSYLLSTTVDWDLWDVEDAIVDNQSYVQTTIHYTVRVEDNLFMHRIRYWMTEDEIEEDIDIWDDFVVLIRRNYAENSIIEIGKKNPTIMEELSYYFTNIRLHCAAAA